MTSLFIGNLSKTISRNGLINAFKDIGPCSVDFKTNKGPYAFVEFIHPEDAIKALRKLNNTNLNGANGTNKVRIEISYKKKIKDNNGGYTLEDESNNKKDEETSINKDNQNKRVKIDRNNKEERNRIRNNNDDSKLFLREKRMERVRNETKSLSRSRSRSYSPNNNRVVKHKGKTINLPSHMKNICFICKLPGHLAKDCLLSKDMCYECGEKGHLAKECKEKVRQAKYLTYNRVKAIRSQQSEFKCINGEIISENLVNYFLNEV
jgi:RNA recognition motif-containing protein